MNDCAPNSRGYNVPGQHTQNDIISLLSRHLHTSLFSLSPSSSVSQFPLSSILRSVLVRPCVCDYFAFSERNKSRILATFISVMNSASLYFGIVIINII